MTQPRAVRIVEVGPRDGLQNEPLFVPTPTKLKLIERLAACGLRTIEATAFVSPRWAPQMADSADVMRGLNRRPGVAYPALVPNLQGFEAAFAANAREVAVFAAASETFSQKNLNCAIAESLDRYRPVIALAREANIKVRAYVSCALGCPIEGKVQPAAVAEVAAALFDMGCNEISLGDTIGVGTPNTTREMIAAVIKRVPVNALAGHFHDTYGMAIANICVALEMGVSVFDASVAGLGGCPYAPGATGNVATEDVVWLLNGLGIGHGVDLASLAETGAWISHQLGRETGSKAARAMLAKL